MKYTRKWHCVIAHYTNIAESCQKLTDDGWSVHTILPSERVANPQTCQNDTGAIIVAFKDEPDLSGGVPR